MSPPNFRLASPPNNKILATALVRAVQPQRALPRFLSSRYSCLIIVLCTSKLDAVQYGYCNWISCFTLCRFTEYSQDLVGLRGAPMLERRRVRPHDRTIAINVSSPTKRDARLLRLLAHSVPRLLLRLVYASIFEYSFRLECITIYSYAHLTSIAFGLFFIDQTLFFWFILYSLQN